jgi:cysteine desulfurase/selenocysteine lyase
MDVTAENIAIPAGSAASALDPSKLRADFPILAQAIHGHPLVYLDNAATTQKPRQVIEAERRYYEIDNANIHRAVHTLSQRATEAYEGARERVRRFVNAADHREIILTRGTTESINLVAGSFGRANLKPGDEILLTALEHHSNIVPWQLVAGPTGAKVVAAPITDAGEVILDDFKRLLSPRTRIVSTLWVSNALGTINPIEQMIALTRRHAPQAVFVVDAAQWVAHGPTDVRAIDCDFLAFSGHKLFGPTGVGVLYGKRALLDAMPPYQGGGDMIETVAFEKTTYAPLPNKFEAGTPNIAGVVGLAAAIEYVQSIGFDAIAAHEHDLLEYATARMGEVPGLRILGTAAHKSAVMSFVIDGISSLDAGIELDAKGIAVRTGHHCCMPLMNRLGVPGTARASFSLYNTREEVDRLVEVLKWIARTHKPSPPAPATPAGSAPSTVEFPAATADSPDAAAAAVVADFEFLQDRNERTQYILDLGAALPQHFDLLKTLTPELPGCMSKVYLIGRRNPASPDRFEFIADSDAAIVRGEIALLQRVFSGQKSSDILAFDVEQFFHRLGLEHLLTVQRRSGLASMVAKIRQLASTET